MVADEDSSDGEEEEACIPDVPEDHSDNRISPKLENTEENMSSLHNQSSELKHMHKYKETKSESFANHSTVHLSKLKSEEEKHEKPEKNRHSSKHHSRNDKKPKESKSNDNSLKLEEANSVTKYSKMDDSKMINDKITEVNKENNKKRKQDSFDSSKKEIKKRKSSTSKSDNEKSQLSVSGKSDSRLNSSNIQIEKIKVKEEPTDKDKQSVKREAEEKSKSSTSSNKSRSKQSSNKTKDSSEKSKYKKEEHTSHKKSDTKKDSSQHSRKELSKSKASSSSSNKDYDKNKDKNQKKERKDDKERDEKKKETKMRLMQEMNGDEGIDCNSGASFAEALGMCTMPQPSRRRHTISPNLNSSKLIKTEPTSPPINNRKLPVIKTEPECDDSPNSLSLLSSNVKLEPLSVDLVSTLPEISPNYKPLPYINPIHRKEEIKVADEIIYVKNQRTKVYSGNKVGYTSVPTLYDMCIRILIENIDALEFTGGVPFDILKPVLERATPDQLFILEHHNPYLMEDTDTLWQFHCNREFKKNVRQEMESWREMYMRCLDEREAKLKTLTANIKQSIDKSVPVRSTKLAYVDNIVKPPRNVLKKQAKYGTANATPATVSSVKKRLAVGGGATNATNIAVPPPPMSRFKASTSNMKKTKAPLMAKALQLIKGRYKR
ncbi:transcription elongation factor B polypeptide 3 isoform X2 [Ooceraea biroi]|nr:transcription elongation factor B polypeptide 3 isoform X2 [Ooceraea biroi]XP_026825859.1 transcription elongation factor B polypeptide 3 isoform X2 [Ooceraea biroi]